MPDDSTAPDKRPPWRHPLPLCAVVAICLVSIGDKYPLTPFPMYSNIDTSADLLMIRNEKDEILPTSRLFNVSSAQGKKRFESTLKEVAGTKDYEDASPEKRQKAGEAFLKKLWESRDKSDVAKLSQAPQKLRAVIRTVSMNGSEFKDHETVVAELDVSKEGGAP